MTSIVISVCLLLGALALLTWAVRAMLTHHCPYCAEAGTGEGMLVPVLPGYRWWCMACNATPTHREVVQERVILDQAPAEAEAEASVEDPDVDEVEEDPDEESQAPRVS